MPMLNVFDSDAFTLIELTQALNTVPVVPGFLGQIGLFSDNPIRSTTVVIEEKSGWLYIIPTAERGTMNRVVSGPKRKVRSFQVPHYPLEGAIFADDAMGLREFGSENSEVPLNTVINDKLTMLKGSHSITEEYARIGAIQGIVYDADGVTEIYDFFSEFGETETTVSFDFSTGINPKLKAQEVITAISTALGAIPYRYIMGVCGTGFYNSLINNDVVEENKEKIDPSFGMTQQQGGLVYGDIVFRQYPGEVNGNPLIPVDECRFFPVGVPGLFQEAIAPANIMQAVGTLGKRYYAVPERMKFDMGIEIHTQHNILPLCTRPKVLVKGTDDTA